MQKSVLSRDFYSFAVLFTALSIAVSIIQSIAGITLGARVLTLGSFYPWIVLCAFIFIITSFALLQYLWYKSYRTAFVFGLISTIVNLWMYVLIYNLMVYRDLQKFYVTSGVIVLSAGTLYAFSLVFSKANKRPLLKRAGVVSAIIGPIMIATLLWSVNAQDISLKLLLEKIHRWASVVGILASVLFLLNLRNEAQLVTDTGEKTKPVVWRELAKVLAILGLLFIGMKFAGEGFRSAQKRKPEPNPTPTPTQDLSLGLTYHMPQSWVHNPHPKKASFM